jgi:cyclase
MANIRVIPTLLMRDGGLVKTIKFSKERYVGDPINAVKIFNEKEVDELVLLDIGASKSRGNILYAEIAEIVSEAFMPVGYGGGIVSIHQIENLFKLGVEKVIVNSGFFLNTNLISEAANTFGSQSIVVSIDVKKDFWGRYHAYSYSGTKKETGDLISLVSRAEDSGAGEIILNNIDRDGTMQGYDLELLKSINQHINIPLVALGGAGTIKHLQDAIDIGITAVSAGSMFIYQGVHKAVLISYIDSGKLLRN